MTTFPPHQSVEDENSDNSSECVVCLSDLRDTLILPCRHLCLCNACADTLRYQANNCPICRLREHLINQCIHFCRIGLLSKQAESCFLSMIMHFKQKFKQRINLCVIRSRFFPHGFSILSVFNLIGCSCKWPLL